MPSKIAPWGCWAIASSAPCLSVAVAPDTNGRQQRQPPNNQVHSTAGNETEFADAHYGWAGRGSGNAAVTGCCRICERADAHCHCDTPSSQLTRGSVSVGADTEFAAGRAAPANRARVMSSRHMAYAQQYGTSSNVATA